MRTVVEIREAIRGGESAESIVQYYLDRIKMHDEKIGAFIEVFSEEALEQAKEVDRKYKAGEALPVLAGVPIGIKDNICYTGHIASSSSKMLSEHKAVYDATVVKRLKDAGAIIIGRLNMDEFAMGSSTETSAIQQTVNPWDETKVPGGSSGGSSAAVAAGFVPAALGSDTGGSIRQPASLCGVTGYKPSYGRVSRFGLIALASSLDQIGPITHTVEDAALLLDVMQGLDPHDATTIEPNEGALDAVSAESFRGMKVGVPKEYFIDGMDDEVRARVEEAIEIVKENGGEVVEVSLPLTEYSLPVYYILQPAEASSNLARFDGMRYGTRKESGTLIESYISARGDGFGTETKLRIMLGTYILSAGYFDAYYKKALAVRTAIHEEFEEVFKDVDVLLTPTSPSVAWGIGEKFGDPITMYLADVFTTTANIGGNPAVSVPCGLANGLPAGLQFIGQRNDDESVLRAAAAYQYLTPHHTLEPEMKSE